MRIVPILLIAALTLSACEASIGSDEQNGQTDASAESNSLSIDAPGFKMKVDLPSVRKFADIEASSDGELLYPGSELSAMHIDARQDGAGLDLRFTSRDAPDTVSGWYRDPARAPDFTVRSSAREGAAHLIGGSRKDGEGSFQLRLEPGTGGGTAGRLLLAES